jgi:hypothetical protein
MLRVSLTFRWLAVLALVDSTSIIANPVYYAAPTVVTVIEASCKNNAEKKDWCTSQEQPILISDENNTQDSSIIDNNNIEPEGTTPPTIEELFTQAKEAGIFISVDATIEWLVTNGISPETLTEKQRNALPIDWNPPQFPPIIEEQLTTNELSNTAIVSDKMGNETIISIDNTVDVLSELTSSNLSLIT